MATLVVTLIVAGTLAFGAVYPWAYLPLFAAAALIGAAGLRRGLRPTHLRFVGLAASAVCAAIAVQLLPLPPSVHETLNPRADAVPAGRIAGFQIFGVNGMIKRRFFGFPVKRDRIDHR